MCRAIPVCAQDCSTVAFRLMIKDKIPELEKLSTADKFTLAVELWDELSSKPEEIPVTEEQLNELDRRYEQYRRDPDKVATWEEAKGKILSSRD
jgi:putative addiction module component (TIGR02574 family)